MGKTDDGKKDDKKPANPDNWDLNKKTGDSKEDKSNWRSAMESWATYIWMEQKAKSDAKPAFTAECLGEAWNKFMNPIVFGKADAKFAGLPDFDFFFKALVYLNANVAGPKSMEIYKKMMGDTWGAKLKASVKKTAAKVKVSVKKAGADISAGAKKVGDWFKKAGNTVANGVKKAAKSLKGGVKLNVKAPSVKVKAGAKVT